MTTPRHRRTVMALDAINRARCEHVTSYCPRCSPFEYAAYDARHKAVTA